MAKFDIPTAEGEVESVQANCYPGALNIKLRNGANYVTREKVSDGAIAAMTSVATAAITLKQKIRVGYEDAGDASNTHWLDWVLLLG